MTQDDKELLMQAAKAIGKELVWGDIYVVDGDRVDCTDVPHLKGVDEADSYWCPLDDDGDALRLAVKLKMVIDTDYNGGVAAGNALIGLGDDTPEYGYQEGNGCKDPYAATRRAITRVAAEMGG